MESSRNILFDDVIKSPLLKMENNPYWIPVNSYFNSHWATILISLPEIGEPEINKFSKINMALKTLGLELFMSCSSRFL